MGDLHLTQEFESGIGNNKTVFCRHPEIIHLISVSFAREAMFPGETTFSTEQVNESPDKQRHSLTVDQSSVMRSQSNVRKNTSKQRTEQKRLATYFRFISPLPDVRGLLLLPIE